MSVKQTAGNSMDTRGIDGLRGIAAAGIAFFSHYYFFGSEIKYPFYNGVTYWFWNYSSFFVDLFFVISGFIMVYVYREKIKHREIGFKAFIKKRFIRFYPLMVFALFCVLFLQLLHRRLTGDFFADEFITDNSLLAFVMNLMCLQGTSLLGISFNSPSWYLSVILVMYILFYVVTYVSGKYDMENLAYAAMLLLGLTLAVKGYPAVFLNCRGMVGFFSGCLLHEACRMVNDILDKRKKNVILGAVFLALILICAIGIRYGHAVFAPSRLVVVVYGMVIWPLLVFLAVNMPALRWLLKQKPFTFLGKISFSMYLIHFPVMIALQDASIILKPGLNYGGKKVFVFYIFLVLAVSILCHYFVERRLTDYFKGIGNEKKL